MDVRTICLGILTRGDATGYEIKKAFEDGGLQHFVEASFGSIYPALSRLTDEGLVSVREEVQEKRPDRKVYSITPAGRAALIGALMKPLPEDRHRSPFIFAMLFADLLPPARVRMLIDRYVAQSERKLAQLELRAREPLFAGERFAIDLAHTMYTAMLDFLRKRHAEFEGHTLQAAE
ncbi:MAG: PadR family transcriptional regulator [Alphaproteobacteria bacterium]|nr:PadR family transcriptional regulator [Alphaproteobacteria bacterium]